MSSRFQQHVRKQVLDFLQTILLIDDEAFRRSPGQAAEVSEDEWPSSGDTAAAAQLALVSPPDVPTPDGLDVQAVSIAFADVGLACAILSPQTAVENDDFKPAFLKTARRADALILDWNMNGDNGTTTEKLVRAVLKDDVKSPRRRLRLITVYTGEPDLQQVAERVCRATDTSLDAIPVVWDQGPKVAFSRGPVRISVFAKEHIVNLASDLEPRRTAVRALPEAVVEEFGRLSMGLVTSASLAALAGIRNDAHRVIAALGPELDPAILGQRIALLHPEDVERQVESLIVSELQAIVQDHEVGRHFGIARIREWLTHHKDLSPRGISTTEHVTGPLRLELLAEGYSDQVIQKLKDAGLSGSKIGQLRKESGTRLFSTTDEGSASSDRILGMRMSLRSRYTKPTPVLQLGSILERGGEYAVCVQPLCDSVRIHGTRAFPLLPLEVATEGDGKPGDGLLTVADARAEGGYVRLRVRAKPAGILMETFKASGSGVVQARSNRGVSRFPLGSGKSWRWLGELKPDHAQRVVERLSSEFSRVGLDESEVLRLGL